MKIAVYGIALNEERHVGRFIAACQGADLVLIADTGSTDGTADALKALGAEVRDIRIDPWRFDTARNAALALLPDDIDVCVSLDLDETLSPGWRAAVERAWRGGVNRLVYGLVNAADGEFGETSFVNSRIHARHGFTWRHPCHELVEAEGEERPAVVADLIVIHQPDAAKPRADYLPLMQLAAREAPDDPHVAFNLARELFAAGRYADAVPALERHLAMPRVRGDVEPNASLRYLAHCREALGDPDGALTLFQRAADERPDLRGAWVELAWALMRRQAWAECLAAAERAIAFPAAIRLSGDDTSPGVLAEDIASLAAWALGRPDEALAHARAGLGKAPGSARLKANLARIEAALAEGGDGAFGVSTAPLDDAGSPPSRR